MEDVILKVENISKQYRLGTLGTGTISHDLNRFWYKVRGKEDPYIKIGETNNRAEKGDSEYVWALKDISFEVKRGEVLGIIGKNGAGKSTLLKILSKVTGPTIGNIKYNGRIASLLEVGTGFHPEMTGKENIFLNGAILGMTKKEIVSKLDEIIEFSGCERYIDTPVKRYSSGMKVRLAFAVAAFLEPDILIVDEVLAVGDAEFQKKAIGKMQDISKGDGRTVLFVSHNMTAVQNLCSRAVVLDKGQVAFKGDVESSLDFYSQLCLDNLNEISKHIASSDVLTVNDIKVFKKKEALFPNQTILLGEKIYIEIDVTINENIKDFSISIDVLNDKQELLSHITNEDSALYITTKNQKNLIIKIQTDPLLFVPGKYSMNLWFGSGHVETLYEVKNFFVFNSEQGNYTLRTKQLPKHSKFYLRTTWELNEY